MYKKLIQKEKEGERAESKEEKKGLCLDRQCSW